MAHSRQEIRLRLVRSLGPELSCPALGDVLQHANEPRPTAVVVRNGDASAPDPHDFVGAVEAIFGDVAAAAAQLLAGQRKHTLAILGMDRPPRVGLELSKGERALEESICGAGRPGRPLRLVNFPNEYAGEFYGGSQTVFGAVCDLGELRVAEFDR